MLLSISIVAVLLVLSAVFSSCETAMTAASRPLMHQLAQTGDRRADVVNRLHGMQDRMIGAILIGNNIVNIGATALATSFLLGIFGDAGVAYATAGMTVLVLIFGEILPKTYTFRHANRLALAEAPFVSFLVKALGPVLSALQWTIRRLFRLAGVDLKAENIIATTSDELRGAIELHSGNGEVAGQERAMLHGILDLTTVWISEIMIHRKNVVAISADAPVKEILAQALSSPFTRIPLWRGEPDNIVGVLHSKALLRAVHDHAGDISGIDIVAVANPPWFVPESTSLLAQLRAFRERKEHFALVVDEFGAWLGIVTLEDILEEIVGDISDEHDVAVVGVRPSADGTYLVQGTVTIRDLNREFDWGLPDQEAVTIAGLLLHEARRIPEVGQVFMFHGCRFEVLRRQRNQITLIRITPPSTEEKIDAAQPQAER